ncbi:hypothetical protein SUGI_0857960 [Cryptomeria japonica]|nr:hypothetical protein SUGI_0857960 [Cryptomeria japonica]
MDGPSINIGAIITFDTISGKIERVAIELAVEDVNRNTSILNGTLLNIDIRDSTQDALIGASAALHKLNELKEIDSHALIWFSIGEETMTNGGDDVFVKDMLDGRIEPIKGAMVDKMYLLKLAFECRNSSIRFAGSM